MPMLQHLSLLRCLSHNSVPRKVYWIPENLLHITLYKDKRTNNTDYEFNLIEFTESISGPNSQNYKIAINFFNADK